jgi:DNA adenine methylase
MQLSLDNKFAIYTPPKSQLFKWVGNKQRFASEIVRFFSVDYCTFYESFIGSSILLTTLEPKKGVGSVVFKPLVELWQKVNTDPDDLIKRYARS